MVEGWPVLLTVEEAGAVLRVGRTKAYALARQWRATDGRSGLPVVNFGHVLRVPRRALEEMIGTDLGPKGIDPPGGADHDPAVTAPPASGAG